MDTSNFLSALNFLRSLIAIGRAMQTTEFRESFFVQLVMAESMAERHRNFAVLLPTYTPEVLNSYNAQLDELRRYVRDFANTIPADRRRAIMDSAGNTLKGNFVS